MPNTNPLSSFLSAQSEGVKDITSEVRASLFRVTERQIECLTWVQEGKSASDSNYPARFCPLAVAVNV
jgi:hypothetical protein